MVIVAKNIYIYLFRKKQLHDVGIYYEQMIKLLLCQLIFTIKARLTCNLYEKRLQSTYFCQK